MSALPQTVFRNFILTLNPVFRNKFPAVSNAYKEAEKLNPHLAIYAAY